MIGRLLRHFELQATQYYAHLNRDWVKDAAVRISESVAADVLAGYSGKNAKLFSVHSERGQGGKERSCISYKVSSQIATSGVMNRVRCFLPG